LTTHDRKSPGLFVTGTDTSVGKTIVTAVLTRAFEDCGVNAGVMKPLETGVIEADFERTDSAWLAAATGVRDPLDLISPYRFPTAASPLVAALRAGQGIDPTRILEAFQALSSRHDCVIVEGIGGVLVPLTSDFFVVDLIKKMALPVLVVARAGLGSINHTLLTLECLRNRGVPILGLVFNTPCPTTTEADESDTVQTLRRLSGQRSFGDLPYCEGLPAAWDAHRDTLIARLDVPGLLEALGLRGIA
jgi:dethiobiotin synthetase